MSAHKFTAATLSIWLAVPEQANAIATLLESGDMRLVECPTGTTILRTHSRCATLLEIGWAPILPASTD